VERSALAAVWRERGHCWLEPHKVEIAAPTARIASAAIPSNVVALRGGRGSQHPPIIPDYEGVGFVSSIFAVSTLLPNRDISGLSRRAMERTGSKPVNTPLACGEEPV
jgi:hypothetical protein